MLILTLVPFPSQGIVSGFAGPIAGSEPVMFQAFSEAEMDELLAPIALYPDPLLASSPASTFVDQIGEAQKTLNGKSDDNLIANQNWDVSVKSIARLSLRLAGDEREDRLDYRPRPGIRHSKPPMLRRPFSDYALRPRMQEL